MDNPLIQIVDEHDRPIGAVTKDELWRKGLWHRVIRIMAEDEQGRVLLQKRTPSKQPHPSCWDNSVGGHVDEGEEYLDAAHRELFEELGIKEAQPEEVGHFISRNRDSWRTMNRFCRVYRIVIDPSQVHSEDPDIAEVRWMTVDEVKRLIAERPDTVTPGLKEVMKRYY